MYNKMYRFLNKYSIKIVTNMFLKITVQLMLMNL